MKMFKFIAVFLALLMVLLFSPFVKAGTEENLKLSPVATAPLTAGKTINKSNNTGPLVGVRYVRDTYSEIGIGPFNFIMSCSECNSGECILDLNTVDSNNTIENSVITGSGAVGICPLGKTVGKTYVMNITLV
jgi:hypothetical protein